MTDISTNIEFYVRASGTGHEREQEQRVIDKLERLDENDAIGSYDVYNWADKITTEARRNRCNFALTKFREFEDWADENGVTIRPFFDVRSYRSEFTKTDSRVVVLPVMCVAAYEHDELHGVYPCSDGDTVYTVEDYLSELKSSDGISVRLDEGTKQEQL